MSDSLWPHELQHAMFSCPSLSPGVCSNLCALSQWCHPTILSSIVPFSSCPQSSPASGSFSMSQLFASGGRGRGASASASVFPMNIQSWFLLGLTGLISLQSKGLSRVFSSTTNWKHEIIRLKYINDSISNNLENNDGPWHDLSREICNITFGCSCACVLSCFSHVRLFVTPRSVARQAPLSMRFSRLEYWSGLPCPPPRDLPDPGIELGLFCLLHWQVGHILYH